MHKMTSISLKMVEIVILSENRCHFVSCSGNNCYFLLSLRYVDRSRVKWNNYQNPTQKMRTYVYVKTNNEGNFEQNQ